MKEKIRIGYIGCGRRGRGMVKSCFAKMRDVEIKYLCDRSEARRARAQEHAFAVGGYRPALIDDYHIILNDPEIDAVVVMTG